MLKFVWLKSHMYGYCVFSFTTKNVNNFFRTLKRIKADENSSDILRISSVIKGDTYQDFSTVTTWIV